MDWVLVGAPALLLLPLPWLLAHRARRRRLYQGLAAGRARLLAGAAPGLTLPATPEGLHPTFARERILRADAVLDAATLARLQAEARAALPQVERSYVPGHKQGGTLAYEGMHGLAPGCLAVYHAAALRDWLSALIGQPVFPTADHDQSSCSLLCYTRAGDHIGWHYDHNFYRGRHFTVLIALVNRGAAGGPSAARLQRRRRDGVDEDCPTGAGTLVVFEGARVLHRALPLGEGEERILLSMTFGTDPRVPLVKEWARRIKDVAFFGPRALWD